ncbi:glucose-dependent insulinotropic receptor [Phyllopteryx taeniolatus]|uniref:glucose-dependent insulinotropic receptor n=1 Tax=Phyllopteryx taeniolatus TaxID=161469 RepID=UPI002AD449FB|nr:glucose-dependent insulinotropic receptor [Phyllopteryx taeniolatus]
MTPAEVRPLATGSVLSVASCLIVGTNLLVAAALLRLLAKRRSQSRCFVLNLALADTLVGLAITGLATEDFGTDVTSADYRYVRQGSRNLTSPAPGKSRCLMRMAFVISPCTASILSMFLISLDRYAAIKVPLRYSSFSGKGAAAGSLVALWACSLIVGFSPVMVRQLQTDGFGGLCAFFSVICPTGIIVLFSVCFFPVLSAFVCIYMDILKIARGHQRQIFRIGRAGSRTSDAHRDPPRWPRARSRRRSHVKALRTVALLVGCFLTLWCPFFLVSIVQLLCKSCRLIAVLENHLWLLGMSNSLINPLVYACREREVRTQIADMFACLAGRGSAPGPVLEVWDLQSHAQT